jgi:hypothetical protein
MTTATVLLADGATVEAPTTLLERDMLLGVDADGNLVVHDPDIPDLVYALTPCCNASGKGSANSPTGICCRACYQPVDSYFGGPAKVTNPRATIHDLTALIRKGPTPADHTTVVVAEIPACDIHLQLDGARVPAVYDAALANVPNRPWAYLCEDHFQTWGPGRLGEGFGQRLILAADPPASAVVGIVSIEASQDAWLHQLAHENGEVPKPCCRLDER